MVKRSVVDEDNGGPSQLFFIIDADAVDFNNRHTQ